MVLFGFVVSAVARANAGNAIRWAYKMDEIIKLLKERILLAEKKKGEYDTLEMDAFWDGQMRCAQDLLNKVSRLTKRSPDARKSALKKVSSNKKGSAKPARR